MNNILHLKYALEVAKTGSISKAAENLYMGQPQVSKAIRELENGLGAPIFDRTSKGVIPTERGKKYLEYARDILSRINEMESLYNPAANDKTTFNVSVPRASYISYAFTELVKSLGSAENFDLNYRETNSMLAINNVAAEENNIAIIRYQCDFENYFLNAISERGLDYRDIWDFYYLALMSKNHPLADGDTVDFKDLYKYTELVHGDISVPALPIVKIKEIEKQNQRKKKIAVYERGSQFELLRRIPDTYMWVSPMPGDVLSCFDLVQKKCNLAQNKYKDIIIFRRGYVFSDCDNLFIQKLSDSVNMVSKNI